MKKIKIEKNETPGWSQVQKKKFEETSKDFC